jgi:hypothetical protein
MTGLANLLKYSLIVVSSVPIIAMYPFVQRYFIKGVMIGSRKDETGTGVGLYFPGTDHGRRYQIDNTSNGIREVNAHETRNREQRLLPGNRCPLHYS